MTQIIMIQDNDLSGYAEEMGDRLHLLMFSASWCGPCKAMAPAIADIADSYADEVAVAKIDIEQSEALAEQFHVRMVPTLVLCRDGQEITRHAGGINRTRISLMIDDVLDEDEA